MKNMKCQNCGANVEFENRQVKAKCPACKADVSLKEISTSIGKCPCCGSENVEAMTRVTGFYSKVNSWNKGKIGELKSRGTAISANVGAFGAARAFQDDGAKSKTGVQGHSVYGAAAPRGYGAVKEVAQNTPKAGNCELETNVEADNK